MLVNDCKQSISTYTPLTKWLHWIMAFLILVVLSYGWSLDERTGEDFLDTLSLHIAGGFLVFGLAVLRLLCRIANPPKGVPQETFRVQRFAARAVHLSLYVLMFFVPLTGLLAAVTFEEPITYFSNYELQESFAFLGQGNFDFRSGFHSNTVYLFVTLIIGHIGAACLHRYSHYKHVVKRIRPAGNS